MKREKLKYGITVEDLKRNCVFQVILYPKKVTKKMIEDLALEFMHEYDCVETIKEDYNFRLSNEEEILSYRDMLPEDLDDLDDSDNISDDES